MSTLASPQKWTWPAVKNDLLSGLTVALALVPEAVAFSFVAGVEPLIGLYAAFIVGFFTALLGRPGMISGATGAMAIVMVPLVSDHGLPYLFAAVILTGILQLIAGAAKVGKFIRMVPHPVMLGFVNGLAIVIFLAQLKQFQTTDNSGVATWLPAPELGIMLGLVALTMAIIHFLPKLTKAIPSSLAAILAISALTHFSGLDVRTVGDIAQISGGFPGFALPDVPFGLETLWIILPYAIVLAGVGLIESLLTLTVIDEMTETKGRPNQECLAQGVGNLVSGFFGAMGGCAMIGQSMINISSGGRGQLSGLSAALFLLAFILGGSALIEAIPIAALIGVMFMVVIGTFEWASLRLISKIPVSDALVIIVVSVVTVFTDLAFAVLVGVVISALVFAWQHSSQLHHEVEVSEAEKVYRLQGSLFFGSTQNFLAIFDVHNDPDEVVVDFKMSRVCDHSGIEAISVLHNRYEKYGKTVTVRNLSASCQRIMEKAKS